MSDKDDDLDMLPADWVLGIIAFFIIAAIVGAMSLTYVPPVEEKFKVTTKAGEVFEIDSRHRCGKHFRNAAEKIYGAQDARLSDLAVKQLPSVVATMTYIYDGKVKENTRCDILQDNVKAITRLPKPKKVQK